MEITPQREPRDLVIEPDGVISDTAGTGLRQFGANTLDELRLGVPFGFRFLRGDARDSDRGGMGQTIRRRLGIER